MDPYNEEKTLPRKEETLQNELNRIRSSASFKFGNHFVEAVERPWKLFLLPFTLPMLIINLITQRKKKQKESSPIIRNCIVLFSTQSFRSLHFDRCEALIDHLNNPSLQFVHITTDNRGIQNERKNVHYYTFPERSKLKSMNPRVWNNKCQTFLNSILDIFSPRTFIFDGDYPFRGLLNSIKERKNMNRFWVRESSLNYKISSLPLDSFHQFDAIIHPSVAKQVDADSNVGSSGSIFCDPIINDVGNAKMRKDFRKKHLPVDSKLILFDVGRNTPFLERIATCLLNVEGIHLLVRSNLRVRSIIDHPKTIQINGLNFGQAMMVCDSAVIYPDHFCVHTAFYLKKPILSVVKEESVMKFLREEMGKEGLPILYLNSEEDENSIPIAIERFTSEDVQQQLIERMNEIEVQPGTNKLCEFLMQYHD